MRAPLGVTFKIPDGQEATGVYEDPNGISAFETDSPYLVGGGVHLQAPLPIKVVQSKTFSDSTGKLQSALAMNLGISPDHFGVVHGGIQVVHDGNRVVHNA